MIRIGEKILDQFRGRKQSPQTRNTANAEDVRALRTEMDHLEQRLEAQEANTEAQAELIVQLARHNAVLVRWLLYLAIGLALSGGVAVAALLLTLLA